MGHTVAKKGTRLSDWFKERRPLESFWNYLLKQVCSQPSRQRPDDSHNVLLVPSPREGARGDPGAPPQAPRRLTGRATREALRGTPAGRGLAPRGGAATCPEEEPQRNLGVCFIYFDYYYYFAAPAVPGSREDAPGS